MARRSAVSLLIKYCASSLEAWTVYPLNVMAEVAVWVLSVLDGLSHAPTGTPHGSLADSALAFWSIGTSASASFHSARKAR